MLLSSRSALEKPDRQVPDYGATGLKHALEGVLLEFDTAVQQNAIFNLLMRHENLDARKP